MARPRTKKPMHAHNIKRRKPVEEHLQEGQPTKYKAEFCTRLKEYLAKGMSFESFGAQVGVHRDTLYEWASVHPKFSDAKKCGEAAREEFLLKMGQSMATGNLRRLVSEGPLIVNGEVSRNPDGTAVITRTYAPASGAPAIWIFMMKNMCRWKDERNLNHGGQEGGAPIALERAGRTREERLAELRQLQLDREACGDD